MDKARYHGRQILIACLLTVGLWFVTQQFTALRDLWRPNGMADNSSELLVAAALIILALVYLVSWLTGVVGRLVGRMHRGKLTETTKPGAVP